MVSLLYRERHWKHDDGDHVDDDECDGEVDKKGRSRIREDEVLTELTPKVISKEETSNFDNIILNGVLCVIAVFIMAGIIMTFTIAIIYNKETSNFVDRPPSVYNNDFVHTA